MSDKTKTFQHVLGHQALEEAIEQRKAAKQDKKYKRCSQIFGGIFIGIVCSMNIVCFIMPLYMFLRFMFAFSVLEAGGVTYMRPACWLILVTSAIIIVECVVLILAISIWYPRFMLITYLTFIIPACALIIGGSLALWTRNQYGWNPEQFTQTAQNAITENYAQPGFEQWSADLDSTQIFFSCCAFHDAGWLIYKQSKWYSKNSAQATQGYKVPCVPLSCCVRDLYGSYSNSNDCQTRQNGVPCQQSSVKNQYVFYDGCSQRMFWIVTQFGLPLGGVAVVNGALTLLAIAGVIYASFKM